MCCRPKVREKISLIIPFQQTEEHRVKSWRWLRSYWRSQLPDAEILIGRDPRSQRRWYRRRPVPFSKAVAVNRAARRAHGDIYAIIDADVWMDAEVVRHCADRLRAQRRAGVRSWFMPYRHNYRMNKHASRKILEQDPCQPFWYSDPPPREDVEAYDSHHYGHQFGALAQIMSREAFWFVGGWDKRFRGWGGEDGSFMRLLDTLWGKHINTPNEVLHLWHPKFHVGHYDDVAKDHRVRVWEGQTSAQVNDVLANRYFEAMWDKEAMTALRKESK